MIKLKLDDSTEFRKLIETVSNITKENKFVFEKDSLVILGNDPTKSSGFVMKIHKGFFTKYEAEGSIILNVSDFANLLKLSKPTEKIDIYTTKNDARINLDIHSKTLKAFVLPLLADFNEPDITESKVADLNPENILGMELSVYNEAIKLLKSAISDNDSIFIKNESGVLSMYKETESGKSAKVEIGKSNIKKDIICKFNQRFMEKLDLLSSTTKDFELGLQQDFPIKNTIVVKNKFTLHYFIAPIVDISTDAKKKEDLKVEISG